MSTWSDGFDSELTELESSDEDDYTPLATPATKQTKGKGKQKAEYVLKKPLKPPRITQYSALSIYHMIVQNTIDLDPEYQRDVVWKDDKMMALIDSIFRNFYMPPIIFAVTYDKDGNETRTCIDGKQRMTSIHRFMDGLIPFRDSITGQRLWYKESRDPKAPRRTILPKQYINAFANKQIACVEYDELEHNDEREMFQRVQLGVALTPAERMQAVSSECAQFMREILKDVIGSNGFKDYIDWGNARGRDFQCITSIAYIISKHPRRSFPTTPATLVKWLEETVPTASFRAEVRETIDVFLMLAGSEKHSGPLRNVRVSPVEFCMAGVLIYRNRKAMSLTQLSSAIELMREDVRKKHDDIRLNGKVTKCMFDFVIQKMKTAKLKSDGKGDTPAVVVLQRKVNTRKRQAPASSDDEDEAPPAKVAKSRTTAGKSSASAVASSSKQKLPTQRSAKAGSSKTAAKDTPKAPAKASSKTAAKPLVSKPSAVNKLSSHTGAKTVTTTTLTSKSSVNGIGRIPRNSSSTRLSRVPTPPPTPGPTHPPAVLTSTVPRTSAASAPLNASTSTSMPKQPRPPSRGPSPPQPPLTPRSETPAAAPAAPLTLNTNVNQESSSQAIAGPSSAPASSVPDRLAAIRQAKVAAGSSMNTPSQSPVSQAFVPSSVAGTVRDPRTRPLSAQPTPESRPASAHEPMAPPAPFQTDAVRIEQILTNAVALAAQRGISMSGQSPVAPVQLPAGIHQNAGAYPPNYMQPTAGLNGNIPPPAPSASLPSRPIGQSPHQLANGTEPPSTARARPSRFDAPYPPRPPSPPSYSSRPWQDENRDHRRSDVSDTRVVPLRDGVRPENREHHYSDGRRKPYYNPYPNSRDSRGRMG
ncbi:hypothetical protein PLICRDRAFT_38996 [Plicaturopsis crispa FD-325 SS-3]|nr:hypothetical protein PLICRDRAFT_38996 [Plicaturopsis crispa FD-325 SS-3]